MKIQVKQLQPNPFRNIKQYPIDRAKVEALKTSIKTTSFWDNILVRKKNGQCQVAYGHHRLVALQELKIKEIDVPVRVLDDATMLRIMAEENLNWSTGPAVINQTVLAVKEFLDSELAKHDTWNHLNKSIKMIFASNSQFENCKRNGIGQTTILKFLGGNWKQWMIQEALDTLKDETIDREAVESLPSLGHARKFKDTVRRYRVPKQEQKKIAQKIATDHIKGTQIEASVRRQLPKLREQVEDPVCARLERLIEDIDNQARTLRNKLIIVRGEMERLNVKQLKGIKVSLAKSSLNLLLKEIKRIDGKE